MRNIDCSAAHTDTIARLLYTYGACSYYLMPYNQNDCETQPNPTQHADAALNKSLKSVLTDSSDVSEYKQFLQIGHPIGVYTNYGQDLKRIWNDGSLDGHWESVTNFNTDSAHALCIVGYDDHQHLFKAMNSWDSIKGDHGFVWVSYDLVQDGVFECAYVFDSRGNGFVPTIEGAPYLCDTVCHYLRNVPAGASIQWQLTNPNNAYYYYTIQGSSTTDSVLVVYHVPLAKSDPKALTPPFPPVPTDSAMTLKATVSSGGSSYVVEKKLYLSSVGVPAISASDTTTHWTRNTPRTFTITNCHEVSDGDLTWIITRTRKISPLFPSQTVTVLQDTGRAITYTPTGVGTYEVIVTNNGKPCGTNTASKTYIVGNTIASMNAEDEEDASFSDESNGDSSSRLQQRITDNNATYTYELWHTIYGRMRVQEVQNANEQINTTGLPQGVYIVLLKDQKGEIVSQTKVII